MIIVNIIEFLVLENIKLNAENVVVGVPVVGEIKQTQMLGRAGSLDTGKGYEDEDYAMARENTFERSYGEYERGRERKDDRGIWVFCEDFCRVKSSTDCERCVSCECENSRINGGVAEE